MEACLFNKDNPRDPCLWCTHGVCANNASSPPHAFVRVSGQPPMNPSAPVLSCKGQFKVLNLSVPAVCQDLRPVNEMLETIPSQHPLPPLPPHQHPPPPPPSLSVTQHSFPSPLSSSLPSSLHSFTPPCHVVSQSKDVSLLERAA